MQPPVNKHTFWYQKPAVWIVAGISICAAFLAMPFAHRLYLRWTGERKVERAEVAFAESDYETAILNARGALATNPTDLEALRIMAKTAEALGSPQALDLRLQIDAIMPGDAENILGLAAAYLTAGNIDAAEKAFKGVPSTNQASTRYHDVAAGIALSRQDTAAAESHTEEAAKLAPTDDSYQFKLARMRLNAKSPELRAGALAVLKRLSTSDATRLGAVRVLLSDAVFRREVDRALEFADQLAAEPNATFSDKLSRLGLYKSLRGSESASFAAGRRVKESEYAALLIKMQTEATASPEHLYQMVLWMNDNYLGLAVQEWVVTLPEELVSKPPVALGIADAYARTSNWSTLKMLVENASWGRSDFLRLAYLSRALDRLGDHGGSLTVWKQSVESTQNEAVLLETLARQALQWDWDRKAEDVLWKRSAKERTPRWAIDHLWTSALKRDDTEALCDASKLILQTDPKNVAARNNFISLSLLTGRQDGSPYQLAEALFKENPENADAAATYGFSLYLQGRAQEAVAALTGLTESQRRSPPIALYHAIFLAAAGQSDQAEEYFNIGKNSIQLPQQKAITGVMERAFQARTHNRAGDAEGCDIAWRGAFESALASPDRIEMLGRLALAWGWAGKSEEIASKLAEFGRCPDWAAEIIWKAALKNGNTETLHRAAKVILSAKPTDFTARNNFATIALLSRNEAEAPQALAQTMYEEHPGDAKAVATYGLAMFRLGRIEQGVAAMRKLKPAQLREPRPALYYGLLLAASGQPDEAEPFLKIRGTEALLPEEMTIFKSLSQVFEWRAFEQSGDLQGAGAAWTTALSSAAQRPELLEVLGRMTLKWRALEKANEALWKLAEERSCPRWVADHLWTEAEKKRDTVRLLKASRLLSKADPTNMNARNHYIWLSLLTGQETDFPHRQAEALHQNNPGNAEVAVTWSLSLYQRGKTNEAITVLAALKPEQLREPKPSLYYGILLAASGKAQKAEEYLKLGDKASLLPEELALVAKIK